MKQINHLMENWLRPLENINISMNTSRVDWVMSHGAPEQAIPEDNITNIPKQV